jgi:hypothetical protein
MNKGKKQTFTITYRFCFAGGNEKVFNLEIDRKTLSLVSKFSIELPEWAKVTNIGCDSCANGETHCKLAATIGYFIKQFDNIPSYEKVKIYVETENRTFFKETSVQAGAGGVFGILMSTSECPILGKLKPMVRYHLPFADIEETEYRVFSMYMLAQYFKLKNGEQPDLEMNHLKATYEEIGKINRKIAKAIADLEKTDTSINAVVALNNFADSVTFSLEDQLVDIEILFKDWMV